MGGHDVWRPVQLIKRFPEVLFNGDFSLYSCGQEMICGGADDPSGIFVEESDRYSQALLHRQVALDCFKAAQG